MQLFVRGQEPHVVDVTGEETVVLDTLLPGTPYFFSMALNSPAFFFRRELAMLMKLCAELPERLARNLAGSP